MLFVPSEPEKRYEKLVLPHVPFLYKLAYQYAGNSYDADDLVQQACYLALKNLHQLRSDEQVRAWLATILRNAFFRTRRPSRRLHVTELAEDQPEDIWQRTVPEVGEAVERRDQVVKLVDGLAEHYKSALLLHTIGGFTYEQIATILDVPIGTVMSRISRAKRLLRERMEALGAGRPRLSVVQGGASGPSGKETT